MTLARSATARTTGRPALHPPALGGDSAAVGRACRAPDPSAAFSLQTRRAASIRAGASRSARAAFLSDDDARRHRVSRVIRASPSRRRAADRAVTLSLLSPRTSDRVPSSPACLCRRSPLLALERSISSAEIAGIYCARPAARGGRCRACQTSSPASPPSHRRAQVLSSAGRRQRSALPALPCRGSSAGRPAIIVQPCAGVPRPPSGARHRNSTWQKSRSGFSSAGSFSSRASPRCRVAGAMGSAILPEAAEGRDPAGSGRHPAGAGPRMPTVELLLVADAGPHQHRHVWTAPSESTTSRPPRTAAAGPHGPPPRRSLFRASTRTRVTCVPVSRVRLGRSRNG